MHTKTFRLDWELLSCYHFLFSIIIKKLFAKVKNLHLFWLVISRNFYLSIDFVLWKKCCHFELALSQILNLKGFNSSWTKEICSLKSIKIIKIQKQTNNVLFLGKVPFSTLPPKLKGLNLISNQERLPCIHFFVLSQEISSWCYWCYAIYC